MIPNVLVHIGYHKTGTTWLQKTLFSAKSSVFFPLSPTGKPKALGRHFVWDKDGNLLSPFESNKHLILEEIETALHGKDLKHRTPVISNERLSGNPHCGGFDTKLIADRIKDCLPNAKIFCVIREQKEMILSTYFQYLRAGGIDSLKEYLTRPYDGRRPGFSPSHFNYIDLISYYYQLFSVENVLVLPYEMLKNDPERFGKGIRGFVAKNSSDNADDWAISYNKRLDDSILPRFPFLNLFLRKSSVNAYSPLYIPKTIKLLHATNWIIRGNDTAYIKKLRKLIDAIIKNRYAASNKKLSGMIGMNLSQYGYHEHERS